MNQAMRSIQPAGGRLRIFSDRDALATPGNGALMECNQKIQVPFVSSLGTVIADLVRSPLLTPAAITLRFQRGRGLGNRCHAACGVCGRVVVAKLVRCQGEHDEQMSLALHVE